jgi:hypothetical protein
MAEPISDATTTANDGSAASATRHNATTTVALSDPTGIDVVTAATLTVRVRRAENG